MTDLPLNKVNIDDCAGFIELFGDEYSPYSQDPQQLEIDLGTFFVPKNKNGS